MMRPRHWLTLTALAACLLSPPARAGDESVKRFSITPMVGWTRFDREFKSPSPLMISDDVYFGGRFDARLHSILWLELAGGVTPTSTCNANLKWSHVSANLMLTSPKTRGVNPFLSLGGGVSIFKPAINADMDVPHSARQDGGRDVHEFPLAVDSDQPFRCFRHFLDFE